MTSDITPTSGPTTLGKYEILWEIARGGMGVVYEAFDPNLERRVAIKTLHSNAHESHRASEMLERFRREAQAAARLNHPNIVTVYEFGNHNGTMFIAMEFVEGSNLRDALRKDPAFSWEDISSIMQQLLAGLGHAHQHGVIHRDVKPANIFLLKNGDLKLGDFGVARVETSDLTQMGSSLGTPTYMAPEQILGAMIDPRSDLFAAGVVLYELLTGVKPFTGEMTVVTHKIVQEDPLWPSEIRQNIPPVLDKLIRQALAKDPEARFQTAQEFSLAIQALQGLSFAPLSDSTTTNYSVTQALQDPSTTFASAIRSTTRSIFHSSKENTKSTEIVPAATASAPRKTIQIPVSYALIGLIFVLMGVGSGVYWFMNQTQPTTVLITPVSMIANPAEIKSERISPPASVVDEHQKTQKQEAPTAKPKMPKITINPYGEILTGDELKVELVYMKEKNEYDLYDVLLKITGEPARQAGIEGKVIKYDAIPQGFPGDFDYRLKLGDTEQTRVQVRLVGNRHYFTVVFGEKKYTVDFDQQLTRDADPRRLLKEYLASIQ